MDLEIFLSGVAINIFSSSLYTILIEPVIKETGSFLNSLKIFSKNRKGIVQRIKERIEEIEKLDMYISYADGKSIRFAELPKEFKEFFLKFIEENEKFLENREKFLEVFEKSFKDNFKEFFCNENLIHNEANNNTNSNIIQIGNVINSDIKDSFNQSK